MNSGMDRGRQILRQWKLLRYLEQSRSGASVLELMEFLGGSAAKRTVYRDLEQLQIAGFPLEAVEGRWKMTAAARRDWSVPVSPSHVLGIKLASRLLEPVRGTWLADPLRELQDRLEVLLSPVGRAYCEELEKHTAATLFTPMLIEPAIAERTDAIAEALNKEHRLRMRYASRKEEVVERVVEPYASWFADGRLYLVAYCTLVEDFRTFAVQRIQSIEVLDEAFDRDPHFELERYVNRGFGVFHDPPQRVVLLFDADVGHLPRERRLHESQTYEALADGTVRLEMTVGGLLELAAWIVGFGGKVRVVAPRKLEEEVLRRYREGLAAQTGDDLG